MSQTLKPILNKHSSSDLYLLRKEILRSFITKDVVLPLFYKSDNPTSQMKLN